MEKMMKTVIDIGSNSIRYLSDAKGYLEEKLCYTRLGEGASQTGELSKASYLRTLEGIKNLLNEVPKESKVILTATSALREAKNREEICEKFLADLGHPIRVLSGEEEAYYNYLGVKESFTQEVLVLDIGGGSTELVTKEVEALYSQSLPIGAVRLYEREGDFLPLSEYFEAFSTFKAVQAPLVGTGGTITSLVMVLENLEAYDESVVNGYVVTREAVHVLLSQIEANKALLNLLPEKRRDIFPSGLKILEAVMAYLSKDSFIVSTKDGLYGLYKEA